MLYNIVADATLSSSPEPQPESQLQHDRSQQQQSMSSNTQELTRYQADARDIQTRLDLMPPVDLDLPPEDVKARLYRIPHGASSDGHPSSSLFEHLETPKDGLTRLEAATRVLNELTDKTEDIASTTRLVMAYVQQNALWMNLRNPRLRSQEGFLRTLNNTTALRINLFLGTWTDKDRERYIKVANDFWGIGWFDKIPKDLLPPLTSQTGGVAYRDMPRARVPKDLSKRMLEAMAANCKLGVSFENAVKGWDKNRIARQTRPSVLLADRRALRQPKISRKLHMVVEDVQSLNVKRLPGELLAEKTRDLLGPDPGDHRSKLAPQVYPKEEARGQHEQEKPKETEELEESEEREAEDGEEQQQHEKEKKTNSTTQPVSLHASKKRDRASDLLTLTTVPNKRVRVAKDPQEDQSVVSKDGRWMVTKVRHHLVRRPVKLDVTDSEQPSSPLSVPQDKETEPSSHPLRKRLYSGLVRMFSSPQNPTTTEETTATANPSPSRTQIASQPSRTRLKQSRVQEIDNSDQSEEEIEEDIEENVEEDAKEDIKAGQYDPGKNKNSKTGKALKSACKSIDALQKLADHIQLSQDFRQCCEECSTAVAPIRLALFQAMNKSRGVHM